MSTLTAAQLEQKKQLLAEKTREMKAIYDELVAVGAIELTDDELNEINGGYFWDKLKEDLKKAAIEATDTSNLSLL